MPIGTARGTSLSPTVEAHRCEVGAPQRLARVLADYKTLDTEELDLSHDALTSDANRESTTPALRLARWAGLVKRRITSLA